MRTSLITIDAGHGGHDRGATRGHVHEADLARLWAAELALELRRRGHATHQTGPDDTFVGIGARAKAANEAAADCFVSVHANQGAAGATGFQVIHARPSAQGEALAEAIWASVRRVNPPGTRDGIVPDQSVHVGYTKAAQAFFDALDETLPWAERDHLTHAELGNEAYRTLGVLRQTKMPAVLLEIGFLSDPEELVQLVDGEHRRRVVVAIADGIEEWLGIVPRTGETIESLLAPLPAPQIVAPGPESPPMRLTPVRLPLAQRYTHRKIAPGRITDELLGDLGELYAGVTDLRGADLGDLWRMAREVVTALDRWARKLGDVGGEEKMQIALEVVWAWIDASGGVDALRELIVRAVADRPFGVFTGPLVRRLLTEGNVEMLLRFILELAVRELRLNQTGGDHA